MIIPNKIFPIQPNIFKMRFFAVIERAPHQNGFTNKITESIEIVKHSSVILRIYAIQGSWGCGGGVPTQPYALVQLRNL